MLGPVASRTPCIKPKVTAVSRTGRHAHSPKVDLAVSFPRLNVRILDKVEIHRYSRSFTPVYLIQIPLRSLILSYTQNLPVCPTRCRAVQWASCFVFMTSGPETTYWDFRYFPQFLQTFRESTIRPWLICAIWSFLQRCWSASCNWRFAAASCLSPEHVAPKRRLTLAMNVASYFRKLWSSLLIPFTSFTIHYSFTRPTTTTADLLAASFNKL